MSAPMKVLVPVDGSAASLRAVDHVVGLARRGVAVEIHVLNVQAPVRGVATSLVSKDELQDFHRDEARAQMAAAIRRFDEAGLACVEHIGVGAAGDTIVKFAVKLGAEQIVMGTHGRSGVTEILLGSVAQHVVSHGPVPVTLVR